MNHTKGCRCVECFVMHKSENCTKGLLCPAPTGHEGPCVGVLGHVRLLSEAIRLDVKAWFRRASQ